MNIRFLDSILVQLFFLTLSSPLFAGTNYYVNGTSGNNSNNGLTTTLPFKTINYGVSKAVHGDTINVMAGTYTNINYGTWDPYKAEQTVRIFNRTTTTGLYLVIRPYNNDKVVLKSDGNFVFQIQNSNYIKVEGLEIFGETPNIPIDTAVWYQFQYRQCLDPSDPSCANYESKFRVPFGTPPSVVEHLVLPLLSNFRRPTTVNSEGILVNASHHVDIINNIVHHVPSDGIRIGASDYCNVIGNTIYQCNKRNAVGTPALVLSTINSIDNNDATKIVVAHNRVFDNRNEVYSWAGTKTFIEPYVDEGKGISLEHCITRSSGPSWHHGRVRIENNICYRNGFSGVNTNEAERVDVLYNTCYNNKATGIGQNIGLSINDSEDVTVYNNIVHAENNFGGDALAVRPLTHVTADKIIFKNNVIVGTIDRDVDSVDINTIFADPQWVDTLEFRLHAGSAARNAAVDTLNILNDFYYQLRNDGQPDAGAVEYKPGCNALVTNSDDGGPGSLRYILDCVAEGDTITFAPHITQAYLVKTLPINKSVTLCHPSTTNKPVIIAYMNFSSLAIRIKEMKTVKIKNVDLKGINNSTNKPLIDVLGILIFNGLSSTTSEN